MSDGFTILFAADGRVACSASNRVDWLEGVSDWRTADKSELAQQSCQTLHTLGCRRHPVVLALASIDCLAESFQPEPGIRKDRQALRYAFEEHLPLDAESIAADFVFSDSSVLGIATRVSPLDEFLEQLESCGIQVHFVTPAALLIWTFLEQQLAIPAQAVVIVGSESSVDVWRTANGQIVDWSFWNGSRSSWAVELDSMLIEHGLPESLVIVNCEPQVAEQLSSVAADHDQDLVVSCANLDLEMSRVLDQVSSMQFEPLINLRRDGLAPVDSRRAVRSSLNAFVAVCMLALVALNAITWWRISEIEAVETGVRREQQHLFAELFPQQRRPRSIERHFRSELTRLRQVRSSTDLLNSMTNPLDKLWDVVASSPQPVDCEITDIDISATDIIVQGRAASLDATSDFSAALESRGYTVDVPDINRLEDGRIDFHLYASPVPLPNPSDLP